MEFCYGSTDRKKWNYVGTAVLSLEALGAVVLVLGNLFLPVDLVVEAARFVAGSHYADQHTAEVLHGAQRPLLIWHVVPSLVFAVIGMLQLLPALRRRAGGKWHRWIGRCFILMAVGAAVTGTLLSIRANYSGWDEIVPSVLFSIALIVFCVMGLIRARQRDFNAHQEWMFLALSSGLGITLARVYLRVFTSATGLPADEFFGTILWMGSGTNLVLALIWLGERRRIRSRAMQERNASRAVSWQASHV